MVEAVEAAAHAIKTAATILNDNTRFEYFSMIPIPIKDERTSVRRTRGWGWIYSESACSSAGTVELKKKRLPFHRQPLQHKQEQG
jgi:hypothetical protein